MDNPWKFTTIGIVTVLITALTTGLTTAYFVAPKELPKAAPARVTYVRPTTRVLNTSAYPATEGRSVRCDSDGKLIRVGRDGLVGGVAGAAVGAGAGAIADRGRGAGKGAAIGGLTGAMAGALYGLHQNSRDCGSAIN